MNNNDVKHEKSYACGNESCCAGSRKWIWILLILAVAGVMIAKNAGKRSGDTALAASETALAMEAGAIASVSESTAQGQTLPRLVDLGADKCIPCKMMKPILDDFKANYADHFATEFIDVWKNPDAGKKYEINVIPTQIFFAADGKELFRHEGFFGKEDMLKKWQEFGVDFADSEKAHLE